MKYQEATQAGARLPIEVVTIHPSVWAQTWTDRPVAPLTLGLRSLSEESISQVTGSAKARADRCHPDGGPTEPLWADEYNRTLVAYTTARALCSPECADVPHWDFPDMAAVYLTPEGASWLFSKWCAAMTRSSILAGETTAEEMGALFGRITARWPLIDRLTLARRGQVAHLLATAIEIIEGR